MSRRTSLIAAAAALMTATGVFAQEAAPSRNAALDYWRGIHAMERSGFGEAAGAVDWRKLGGEMERLPAEFTAAASLVPPEAIDAFTAGASAPSCDFQIEYKKGPFAVLPHLSGLRLGTRALVVDARRLAASGDGDGSARRLAVVPAMAAHLRSDRVLICSLVSASLLKLAILEIDAQLDAGRLPAAARAVLADSFEPFAGDDPLGVRASLLHGERAMLSWVKESFHGPTAGRDLVASGIFDSGMAAGPAPARGPAPGRPAGAAPVERTDPDRTKEAIMAMDERALHAEVDRLWPFYEQAVAAWAAPDAPARLRTMSEGAAAGGFGVLGPTLAPALLRAYEGDMKSRDEIARIVARLRE